MGAIFPRQQLSTHTRASGTVDLCHVLGWVTLCFIECWELCVFHWHVLIVDSETQLTKNLITKVLLYFSIVVTTFFQCIHHIASRMENNVVYENADFRMKTSGNRLRYFLTLADICLPMFLFAWFSHCQRTMEQGAKDSNWETFKDEKEKGAFESNENRRKYATNSRNLVYCWWALLPQPYLSIIMLW